MDKYYLPKNGEIKGPFDISELEQMMNAGEISVDSYVSLNSKKDFQKIGNILRIVSTERVKMFEIIGSKINNPVLNNSNCENGLRNENKLPPQLVTLNSKIPPPLKTDHVKIDQQFFLVIDDMQKGPLSLGSVIQLLNSGVIDITTLAWTSGMIDWKKISEIEVLNK